jgi:hypothetical protein
MATQKKTVQIFYHYHPADNAYARDFEKCLTLLKQLREVSIWSNKEIVPGSETEVILTQQLELSDIVFLLVSRDFLVDDSCRQIQKVAMEHRQTHKISVIPLILRPSPWKSTPLGDLQPLPRNEKPISKWSNRDDAFENITEEITEIIDLYIDEIIPQRSNPNKAGVMFIGHYPIDGYRWDNSLLAIPSFAMPGTILDGPWLVSSQPFNTPEVHKRYSIFDKENILHDFISLPLNEEAILVFANNHGHLGKLQPLCYPDESGKPNGVVWQGEALASWYQEIEELNFFVTLWKSILHRQTEVLGKHILWRLDVMGVMFTWEYGRRSEKSSWITAKNIAPELLYRWEWGDVIGPAMYYLCKQINDLLRGHINTSLLPFQKNEIYMVPDTLLSALYMLLSMEIRDHPLDLG